MKNDTLIRIEGMKALTEKLGMVNAERFIALILREPFDYTKWQRNLYEGISLDDFLNDAANFRQDAKNNKTEQA